MRGQGPGRFTAGCHLVSRGSVGSRCHGRAEDPGAFSGSVAGGASAARLATCPTRFYFLLSVCATPVAGGRAGGYADLPCSAARSARERSRLSARRWVCATSPCAASSSSSSLFSLPHHESTSTYGEYAGHVVRTVRCHEYVRWKVAVVTQTHQPALLPHLNE